MTTIADVVAAAERLAGHAHRTPVMRSTAIDELVGARVYFKCGDLPEDRRVQVSRRVQRAIADRERRDRRILVGESRAGGGARGTAARQARDDRDAGRRPAVEARRDARLRRRGRALRFASTRIARRSRKPLPPSAPRRSCRRTITPTSSRVRAPPRSSCSTKSASSMSWSRRSAAAVCYPARRSRRVRGRRAVACTASSPAAGNDGQRSLAAGEIIHIATPDTIADGAQTQHLGRLTFPIIQREVAGIVTASDDELVDAMILFAERLKLVVEPTGCLGLAGLRHLPIAGRARGGDRQRRERRSRALRSAHRGAMRKPTERTVSMMSGRGSLRRSRRITFVDGALRDLEPRPRPTPRRASPSATSACHAPSSARAAPPARSR